MSKTAPPSSVRVELGERSYPILIGPGLLDAPAATSDLPRGQQRADRHQRDGRAALRRSPRRRAAPRLRRRSTSSSLPDGEAAQGLADAADDLRRAAAAQAAIAARRCSRSAAAWSAISPASPPRATCAASPSCRCRRRCSRRSIRRSAARPASTTRSGKNMIGAFHQPLAVVADVDVLETLPRRASSSPGWPRSSSTAPIADDAFLGWIEEQPRRRCSPATSRRWRRR